MSHRARALGVFGAIVATLGCGTPFIGGESAYCGSPAKVAFHYATFSGSSTKAEDSRKIWSASRRVVLGDPLGIEGADITDLRLVELGSGATVAVGGSVGNEQATGRSGDGSRSSTGPWRLDVVLTREAASRLSSAVEEISGSYQVVALVVGGEVFSASVDLPVRLSVARIEFPETRSLAAAREFFRQELGCTPTGS